MKRLTTSIFEAEHRSMQQRSWFISKIVAMAMIFFKSCWRHSFIEESTRPKIAIAAKRWVLPLKKKKENL